MAQDWYYKLLGEETGPVTFAALRELVENGHLTAEDEVRTSTSGWKRVDDVPSLLEVGDVGEPELATDMDLDLLLAPSSSPQVKVSAKRQGQRAAIAAAAAPVAQWYYKMLGHEMGPTSEADLIQQIQAGSLHGEDLVRLRESGVWQPLEQTLQFSAIIREMRPKPEWYCRVLRQTFGPMIFEELQQMAKSGALNSDDEVRHGASDPWAKADRVRGLKFPKAATAQSAPAHDRNSTLVPFGEAAQKREWYYEIVGQQMGPISFTEMAKAVSGGTLKMEDKARRGTTGAWTLVINVPGLVSTEDKAAYLATKSAASRPQPLPPKPVAPAPVLPAPVAPASPPPVALSPQKEAPPPVAPAAPPPRPLPSSAPAASAHGASGSTSGYGSMASMSPPALPRPPAFTPSKKSGGSSSGLGDLLADLKDKLDPKAIAAIAVLCLAGLYFASSQFGFRLSFGPPAGAKEFSDVNAMWIEIQEIHKLGDQPAAWAAFKAEHEGEIKALLASVEKQDPGASRRLLQLMLFCTKHHFPNMMSGGEVAKQRYAALEADMKEATQLVQGK